MPSTTFDLDREAKPLAQQISKLINSEAYGKALVEIKQRVERHEARVSAAVDLSMALKGSKLAFKEAHTNGDSPDRSGDVKMMYYVDNFGTIEIGYGGSYYIKPDATTASAWRIAAAIKALLS
jgi:non-homologous end joining protein Ku